MDDKEIFFRINYAKNIKQHCLFCNRLMAGKIIKWEIIELKMIPAIKKFECFKCGYFITINLNSNIY